MSPVRVTGESELPQVIIDRPERANSLDITMLEGIASAVGEAVLGGARAVVLSGAGGKFSAGADLGELAGTDADLDDAITLATSAIRDAPVPIIAAVERYAMGAAVDIAWSCDAVVVAADARVAIPATRLGVLYNTAALRRLHSHLGTLALRRLLLFGEELTGADVADAGLAIGVPPGQAADVANRIAAGTIDTVPAAVAATKRFLNAVDSGHTDTEDWDAVRRELWVHPGRVEALQTRQRSAGDR